jgi:hypothetical protein
MHLFLPGPRETNLVIFCGFAALGGALYLRHMLIEAPALEAACAALPSRPACALRRIVIELRDLQFFGGAALLAAILHLLRPQIALFVAALVAAILGLVLGNAALAALAAALLVISFARPAPTSMRMRAPERSPQARAPPSSETSP